MLPLALIVTASASALPPPCAGGVVIDLGATPSIVLDGASQFARLSFEGRAKPLEARIEEFDVPGLKSSGWTFSPLEYLEWKGLSDGLLRAGGALRISHGVNLDTELERTETCIVTLDPGPVSVRVAQEQLDAAKKKAAMLSVMICDPNETREHKIKAPVGSGSIKIPIGQAGQNEGLFAIRVETSDSNSLGHQEVTVKGGKFAGASSTTPDLFCNATSFDTMCVNTDMVFKLSGDQSFRISTEVDWFEMILTACLVSR